MAGFGERLQREREMRGVTLDAIAAATKIGTRTLRALEQEDFNKLPGGIFNKGFVRSYARYLGMDEDQAVAEYLEAAGEPVHEDPLDADRLKKLEENWRPPRQDMSDRVPTRFPWAMFLVLLVILAGGMGGWRYYQKRKLRKMQFKEAAQTQQVVPPSPLAAPQATTQSSPAADLTLPPSQGAAAQPAPSKAAPSQPATAPSAMPTQTAAAAAPQQSPETPPPSDGELVLLIRARDKSWIKVIADGEAVMTGTLSASEQKTFRAKNKIVLTAGNAGGLDLSFDGKPQPSLGKPAEARTVTFTAAGMQ